jgi:hypothetical protein
MHDNSNLGAVLPTLIGKVHFIEGKTPLPVVLPSGASDTISYPDLRACVIFDNGYGMYLKTVVNPPLAKDRTPMMAAVDEIGRAHV